ncbi:MAG: hypothetical protein ABSF65_08455 [Candidatus Bathyarchaeia archaeon]|jgi:hypothetical protein
MSKEKLEKDFQDFNLQIEKLAEEELKSIREKAEAVRVQARRVGEAFENSAKETNQSGKQKG